MTFTREDKAFTKQGIPKTRYSQDKALTKQGKKRQGKTAQHNIRQETR